MRHGRQVRRPHRDHALGSHRLHRPRDLVRACRQIKRLVAVAGDRSVPRCRRSHRLLRLQLTPAPGTGRGPGRPVGHAASDGRIRVLEDRSEGSGGAGSRSGRGRWTVARGVPLGLGAVQELADDPKSGGEDRTYFPSDGCSEGNFF